jgi:polyhydroxybutyrate depolymerase
MSYLLTPTSFFDESALHRNFVQNKGVISAAFLKEKSRASMSLVTITLLALVFGQSEPCSPACLGPGDHFRTLEVDKQKRTYWIHVPAKYDAKKETPVVLALHGATMSAKTMEAFSGLNKKADAAGFIVVYPNGTGPNPFLLTWNSGGFASLLALGKPNDVGFIAKVLDDLEGAVNVDKKRVYATGISNGAMMCYRLAAELSDRIAAIAPVSGTIALEKFEPELPVPVLHIHGTADSLVPYQGSSPKIAAFMRFLSVEDTIAACVKCNGCESNPKITQLPTSKDHLQVTRRVYEAGADGAEVILYTVEGGGHTWPGRPFGGGILGSYTMNMEANDVIWEFFSRHPRK